MKKTLLLSLLVFLGIQVNAQSLVDLVKDVVDKEEKSDTTDSKDKKMKSYEDVITDKAVTSSGLMKIHKVEDVYYLEIPELFAGTGVAVVLSLLLEHLLRRALARWGRRWSL